MGVFDFLKPKKKQLPISLFANSLTIEEKAAIYTTMLFMVTLQGTRRPHPEEARYINVIKENILGLTLKEEKSINFSQLNFPAIIIALSDSNKQYFSSVFFGLSTITLDPMVTRAMTVFIEDMGLKVPDVAKKYAETENEMNNNPYLDPRFKTKK